VAKEGKMKEVKKPFTVRLPPDQIKKLKESGVNFAPLIQDFIASVLESNVCPCCGNLIKKN